MICEVSVSSAFLHVDLPDGRQTAKGRQSARIKPKHVRSESKQTAAASTQSLERPQQQPSTPRMHEKLDTNGLLSFSERDFVHSAAKDSSMTGSSSSDDFVMSGGLGDMTATQVQRSEAPTSRSRSRSVDSWSEENIRLTKKRRTETTGVASPPKITQALPGKKARVSKKVKQKETPKNEESDQRRQTTYTPRSSSPPPKKSKKRMKPVPIFKPLKPLQNAVPQADSQGRGETQARSSPKLTATASATTSSAARLKKRKERQTEAATNTSPSREKQAPTPPDESNSGRSFTSSTSRLKDRKQETQDKPPHGVPQPSRVDGSAPPARAGGDRSNPLTAGPSAVTASHPTASLTTAQPQATKQQAQSKTLPPTASRPQASKTTAAAAISDANGEDGRPPARRNLPELALELNYNRRAIAANELTTAVAHGELREKERKAAQKAARKEKKIRKRDGTRKPDQRRESLPPVVNGSAAQSTRQPEKPTKPTTAAIPESQPSNQPTAAKSNIPTNTSTIHNLAEPPFPSLASQPPFQHLPLPPAPGSPSLTPSQFTHIFHHVPAATQAQMRRLWRWAVYEERVGPDVGMEEFFCSLEGEEVGREEAGREERAWLVGVWGEMRKEEGKGKGIVDVGEGVGGEGRREVSEGEGRGKERAVVERAVVEREWKRRKVTH